MWDFVVIHSIRRWIWNDVLEVVEVARWSTVVWWLVQPELLLVSSPDAGGRETEGEPETEVSGEQVSRQFQFQNVLFPWAEGYFGHRFEKLHNRKRWKRWDSDKYLHKIR